MNNFRCNCSSAVLAASWLAVLLVGSSGRAEPPGYTFAELNTRIERDGVDRVADELLAQKNADSLAQRIAGTLDQSRYVLRQVSDQLWFQLASRNVAAGDQFTEFLGDPPPGPMLRAKTAALRQYSPELGRTVFESPPGVSFIRLSDDRTKIFCVLADNSLRVLDAKNLGELARHDKPAGSASTPYRLSVNNPWVGVDAAGGFVFAERPDDFKNFQATGWQRALQNVYDPARIYFSSGVLTPDGRHVVNPYERFNYIARSIDGGSDRVVFGVEQRVGIPKPVFMRALPDGERIVVGDDAGTLALFNWRTGKQLQIATRIVPGVSAYAISDDGTRVALAAPNSMSGGDKPQIVVWDIDPWREAAAWRVPERTSQQSVDFLGDRDTIVPLADEQGGIAVWRVGSKEPIRTIAAPTPIVKCLANKAGDKLYVVSDKGALMLLDPDEPNPVPPAQQPSNDRAAGSKAPPAPVYHTSPVRALAVSADGRLAASLDARGEVALWQTDTGRQLGRAETPQLPHGSTGVVPSPVGVLVFAPDNRTVLVGTVTDLLPTVLHLDVESGDVREVSADDERLAVFREMAQKYGSTGSQIASVKRLQLRPTLLAGGKVAVCRLERGQDRSLVAFDPATGTTLHDVPLDPNWGEQIVVAARNSVGLVSNTSGQAAVTLVDLPSAKTESLALFPGRFFVGVITPDGAALAALGSTSRPDRAANIEIAFGKLSTGKVDRVDAGVQSALAISPDGKRVLTGDQQGNLSQWSMRTRKRVATFTLDHQITALACDAHTLAVGDSTGRVHLFAWEE